MENPYVPHVPTERQALFLAYPGIEALYGGAAGGGKSDGLLMAALQFVHVPGYSALLLRKTFADLNQPNALIPRSFAWLGATPARYTGAEHQWEFPTGAVLKFGYLDTAKDIYQYQSAEFQFIGFDELTHFREFDYRYLFSRLRRLKDAPIPLRMRAGSNPGGIGHEWVKRRFLTEGRRNGRVFIPAKIADNPYLDAVAYRQSLSHLDPVTRKQLEEGDWAVKGGGSIFNRTWFKIVSEYPKNQIRRWCRYWDLAATEKSQKNEDPDWTAGALVAFHEGQWWMKNVTRFRTSPKETEDRIKHIAKTDPPGTFIRMEQEGGASGKSLIDHYARNILAGHSFLGIPSLKDKITRAGPLSSAAESGNVILIEGDWMSDFLDELEAFPDGNHDDQVDAATGAMAQLSQNVGGAFSKVNIERDTNSLLSAATRQGGRTPLI